MVQVQVVLVQLNVLPEHIVQQDQCHVVIVKLDIIVELEHQVVRHVELENGAMQEVEGVVI